MRYNKIFNFLFLVIVGTLFLLPSFYRNKWKAVEPAYYDEWQIRYDRMVIARLVETRQNGFFSSGGLLGLGDTDSMNYMTSTNRHQINSFLNNKNFETYMVYKSNPGFQGVLYGALDKLPGLDGAQKINLFRGITATASAIVFGVIFSAITTELGLLAGISMLIFSAASIWVVLPAGSIFWNLWAFFLPFTTSIFSFSASSKSGIYKSSRTHILLFSAILLRILLGGFDIITSGLIMATVPIVFYTIYDKWDWKVFLNRFIKASLALTAGTIAGLLIMSVQIAVVDPQVTDITSYIFSRFGSHFAGNSKYYLEGNIEATRIGIVEVISKYLLMPAIKIPLPGDDAQILYWHLIVLFSLLSILFFLINRKKDVFDRKALALITATWYSILAPLSWIILFRPHSIIHTHVNTMGWQMPFTLLGFALCGYVITDSLKLIRKTT